MEALMPKVIVMENVPGILTIGGGAVVAEIFSRLGELGYECDGKIFYAEDFGVPQERRRFFLIATRLGWKKGLLPTGTHGPAPKPKNNPIIHSWLSSRNKKNLPLPTVWSAIADLPRLQNGQTLPFELRGKYRLPAETTLLRRLRKRSNVIRNHEAPKLGALMLRRIRHVSPGGSWRNIPFSLLPKGMQRAKKSDHTKRYGRLKKQGRCCTILTKCDPHWGSYVHPEADRVLTVREAARIQTFSDRFVFMGTRGDQYTQVGNAVPPFIAGALARTLKKYLKKFNAR